ncbi:MAG TPA: cobalt ECF transporter T component CbiQ [Bryobacteraceae bacterium]|nr:cobalt ECF transporter T component CbiQ [Bryobacteraceae bacterium]
MAAAEPRGMKATFIERTLASLTSTAEYAARAELMAAEGGVLQRIDPRVKVAGMLALVIVVAASHSLAAIGAIFIAAMVLAVLSRVSLARIAVWIWGPALFFTGTIAIPAVFLTPGPPLMSWGSVAITVTGLRSAAFLIARAETAATLSGLMVLTTPWPHVLKALRTFRFPMVFVAILGMTYRYLFVMLQTAFEMFESRKSRTVGELSPPERRRLAASAAGVLLSKSIHLSGDVHLAMQSRGFRGEVYLIDEFQATAADWGWAAGFCAFAAAALWWGR